MLPIKVQMNVRRVSPRASVIDIQGEVTAFAEDALMTAFTKASSPTTRIFLLNFFGLEYMNSSGIGLIVTLLIRINRQKQQLWVCGLSDHYRYIFELTRLSDAIKIFNSEAEALDAASLS